MTMTTDEQATQAAEPEVPTLDNARWVTVTSTETRDDLLLPDFPMQILRRVNADGYRVLVPDGYGRHDHVRREDDGTVWVSVARRHLAPAAGPKTDTDIPADIAAMSREELAKAYAQYKFRTERTIKHVHRHAQIQGMCGTFDQIMERCGWPPRPRKYEVVLRADRKVTMTSENFLAQYVGRRGNRTFEGLGEEISVTEPVQASITKQFDSRPTADDDVYSLYDRDEVEEQFKRHVPNMTGVDLDSVKIHTVY